MALLVVQRDLGLILLLNAVLLILVYAFTAHPFYAAGGAALCCRRPRARVRRHDAPHPVHLGAGLEENVPDPGHLAPAEAGEHGDAGVVGRPPVNTVFRACDFHESLLCEFCEVLPQNPLAKQEAHDGAQEVTATLFDDVLQFGVLPA